ncbi:MAG: AraC family transcriptional regulator [Akkermansiaceae bacterium]|jgi:AraC-like DNA-binding protein|nr:AraC family transcriptional regulator [Akkermansiaceae bacterium]MDP4645980.1 AraC family transcriptional regulator [Akkermansiaceae bacterium]MDP4721848.1 AraC family transcriptional regulator [Akkermansiaceae bacterium]MDP4781190.1 AraC family transcriptional regulator [Akkermansiaceae bacterium]MDP4848555.1 AraC family transcriptional regulator [Akkermansiaceae bacterium]
MNAENDELLGAALVEPLLSLFAGLPDVLCWVKDAELRTVWVNPTVAYYVNMREEDIIGKTDMEIYPEELAINFEKDDRYVIRTGEGIVGKTELLVNRFGTVEWRKITKLPVLGKNGKVIGTTGISVPFDNAEESLPDEYQAFSRIIEFARENLHKRIGVSDLAAFAGMSESTLNRRFRVILQYNPQQLLAQLRVAKACQLLQESVLNVSEIAERCGYDSPAAFARAFKKVKHTTPRGFRAARKAG